MPVFGLAMPKSCRCSIWNSQSEIRNDKNRFDAKAQTLCSFVREEFRSICRVCEWWNSERSAKTGCERLIRKRIKTFLKEEGFLPYNLSTQVSTDHSHGIVFHFRIHLQEPFSLPEEKVNTYIGAQTRAGDHIRIIHGSGKYYTAVIDSISRNNARFIFSGRKYRDFQILPFTCHDSANKK